LATEIEEVTSETVSVFLKIQKPAPPKIIIIVAAIPIFIFLLICF